MGWDTFVHGDLPEEDRGRITSHYFRWFEHRDDGRRLHGCGNGYVRHLDGCWCVISENAVNTKFAELTFPDVG
jgi:hypothetical protein